MRARGLLLPAIGVGLAVAVAQEPPAPKSPPDDILSRRIVYSLPGMERVVRRRVTYRTVDDVKLPMDIYTPPDLPAAARRPAVIFIHGGPVSPEMSPTEWGVYRSYGELAAASGLAGITFKHRLNSLSDYGRAAGDVSSLLQHVRANAASLQVDADRLALWAFSGGGALLSIAFQNPPPFLRCVVSYYGILDVREPAGSTGSPAMPEPLASQLSPAHLVRRNTGPFPPILIARAALDSPRINQSVDEFFQASVSRDVSVDLLTLPHGRHGFDVLDDDDRSREVIEGTLAFLKSHLR